MEKKKRFRSTKEFEAERKGLDRRPLKGKATTFWTTLKQGNLMQRSLGEAKVIDLNLMRILGTQHIQKTQHSMDFSGVWGCWWGKKEMSSTLLRIICSRYFKSKARKNVHQIQVWASKSMDFLNPKIHSNSKSQRGSVLRYTLEAVSHTYYAIFPSNVLTPFYERIPWLKVSYQ